MTAAQVPGATLRRAARISVVLPVYNEARVLRELAARVSAACRALACDYEIVFVNDGSSDDSGELLDELAAHDPALRTLRLSRNFGHQAAVQAGLCEARGDAIVLMDSDLQDTPEAIGDFVHAWEQGWDVVYAIRTKRKESLVKCGLFAVFYKLLRRIADTSIPLDAGNFGLIDARVRDAIVSLPERDRYYAGLRAWVGFRQKGIVVERQARYDDHPRVTMRGLFRLAATAIFSFSALPVRFFYLVALTSLAVCLAMCVFTLYHKLITGLAIPGWASELIMVSLFGTLNALGIGVLGEYVIRIYDQVRGRPVYVTDRVADHEASAPGEEACEDPRGAPVSRRC